jgi:predicted RND superfamily exporter protein
MSLVQIQLDEGLSEKIRNGALANIQKVVSTSDPTPGTKVTVTGSPAFSKEMSTSLGKDMGMLIGGAMVLIIIVMGILFAYVRYRFCPSCS